MENNKSLFERAPRYDPSGESYLDDIGKGLREQLKESGWMEKEGNSISVTQLKEYLLEIFSKISDREPRPLDVFKEVSPGMYYLGHGIYGGEGALKKVREEMQKLANNYGRK